MTLKEKDKAPTNRKLPRKMRKRPIGMRFELRSVFKNFAVSRMRKTSAGFGPALVNCV